MSPILVRPVREQLEHDRIIRQLQAKFRRKYEVGINPGAEQAVPVGIGPAAIYPDVVLMALDRGRKVQCVVEVETGESVNHLEALAEWSHLSRVRVPFHLYVPAGMVDVARRLSEDNNIYVSEIWSYHPVGDQMRFTMVYRNKEAPPPPPKKAPVKEQKPKVVAKPAVKPAPKKAPAPAAKKKAAKQPAKKKKK
ncbi:MAG TPA: hypothetical protein VH583_08425 [Vicinamibacterales bacterium]